MVLFPSRLTKLLYENQLSVEMIWQALLGAQVLTADALAKEELVLQELSEIFTFHEGGKRDGEITGPTMCDAIECRLRAKEWLNDKGTAWSDER